MINLIIKLPNMDRISTSAIGSVTVAPKAVVITTHKGELLVWIKCASDEIAAKTRDEIYRVQDSARDGKPTEANFSFWNNTKAA